VGQLVAIESVDGVATITLDSPANRNALSQQLVADLHAALDEAERSAARVIVLTHTPPAFCAGADLKERGTGRVDSTSFVRAIDRLSTIAAPVIAAVDGVVRAGGVGLMAACDLVVVNPSITFAFTEVRIGVAPAIITAPILQRCGWSKLAGPYLTGEVFDAPRALDMGLVTHVTDDVAGTVGDLTRQILLGGPYAVAATKALLRRPHSIAELQALSESLFLSDEGREGMAAFAEKRPPRWVPGRSCPIASRPPRKRVAPIGRRCSPSCASTTSSWRSSTAAVARSTSNGTASAASCWPASGSRRCSTSSHPSSSCRRWPRGEPTSRPAPASSPASA